MTNYCSQTIDPLVSKGSITEIFSKEPEYKKFAERFGALQGLANMHDQAFEASLKPAITMAGSRALDALNRDNLAFLYDMKMRDAQSKASGPAPQETHQLALHTHA